MLCPNQLTFSFAPRDRYSSGLPAFRNDIPGGPQHPHCLVLPLFPSLCNQSPHCTFVTHCCVFWFSHLMFNQIILTSFLNHYKGLIFIILATGYSSLLSSIVRLFFFLGILIIPLLCSRALMVFPLPLEVSLISSVQTLRPFMFSPSPFLQLPFPLFSAIPLCYWSHPISCLWHSPTN